MNPKQLAKEVYENLDLEFNPYASGTIEHREFADEMLLLTSKGVSGNE
jgi:hypothetical protein